MGKRRAASEMLGAIIVAVVTIAMSVAYAGYGLTQAQAQTASISDVLRSSARAQRQLLTLTYYCRSGDGRLRAYIYNMGSEDSTLKTIIVGPVKYDLPNANVQLRDAVSGQPIGDCRVAPKRLVELSVPAQSGQVDVLVLTEEGGKFIWRLSM